MTGKTALFSDDHDAAAKRYAPVIGPCVLPRVPGDAPEHERPPFRGNPQTLADVLYPDSKPPREMMLPTDPAERKMIPIGTGVLDYFPLALAEVARVSKAGNEQHHPGQPLHWDKTKSMDHADCIPRHFIDRFTRDTDGQRHMAKLAWRALAMLETYLEQEARP
jgi:hypothetical protein